MRNAEFFEPAGGKDAILLLDWIGQLKLMLRLSFSLSWAAALAQM